LAQAFVIIGMVDDDLRKTGKQIKGCKIVGKTWDIPSLVEKFDVGLILYANADAKLIDQERVLSICQDTPSQIVLIPDVLDALRVHFQFEAGERKQLFKKVFTNSTVDRITNVYNRQHFIRLAERELTRSRRYQHPASIIMCIVDYARPGNATLVRAVGDQVLRDVAQRIHLNIREVDIMGRFDSNQFAILLPETDLPAAHQVSDRLKTDLIAAPVETDRGPVDVILEVKTVQVDNETPDLGVLFDVEKDQE
jgi:diguanylate cyclase (GGDEF)-like protein